MKPTTNNLFHFTSKMYLVTYEQSQGLGSMTYGIVQVFNKPKTAHNCLKKLLKEQDAKPFDERSKISYSVKTVDLSNPLITRLFEYCY
jgi:hypothetical protein